MTTTNTRYHVRAHIFSICRVARPPVPATAYNLPPAATAAHALRTHASPHSLAAPRHATPHVARYAAHTLLRGRCDCRCRPVGDELHAKTIRSLTKREASLRKGPKGAKRR